LERIYFSLNGIAMRWSSSIDSRVQPSDSRLEGARSQFVVHETLAELHDAWFVGTPRWSSGALWRH